MKPYQYLILRYVHNVSTEEFANIGILMWLPEEKRILHHISERYARISAFFDSFDGHKYRNMVRHLQAKLREAEKQPLARVQTAEELVNIILPREDSSFQWSSVMGGVAADPEERLRKIFDSIINRHSGRHDRTRRDEGQIYQNLITRLQRRRLADKLQKDVELEGEHFDYKFKLGWQNGTKQFLEPISFDYATGSDVVEKAYTWSGRLQDLGKRNDFMMTGVVAPPQDEKLLKDYAEAVLVLKDSPRVRSVVTIDEFDRFMPEIERDLADTHKR
jgi:hypothetical protein